MSRGPSPKELPGAPVDSRRLRVLHIGKYYPPHHGGIETHLQLLCDGLRAHVDLEVIVASDDREDHVELLNGARVVRVGTALHFAGAPVCPGMVRRIARTPADIVHLHLPNPSAVLAYLASGHPGRLVLSYHSDVIRQRALALAFRPVLELLLRRCEAVIAATPNYIAGSPVLSRCRERCRVIPYGIPLPPNEKRGEAAGLVRDTYGSRLIVGVGRLVYYKGFETLIEAMQWVDGRLLLVGDGPLRARLEAQARALGVAERVVFLGAVDDVTPFYQAASLFALASVARSESFGIVQLEAMACGTPVINTQLDSGVPYVSRHGETGLTIPPGEPHLMADAINQLLDDPTLRERFGRAARARVEEEFSQEIMTRRMLSLYHRITGRPEPEWEESLPREAAAPIRAPASRRSMTHTA